MLKRVLYYILANLLLFSFFQYDELDGLGFKGFAVAFYREYAQVIGTSGTVETFTPVVHEYFHGLVTVGK